MARDGKFDVKLLGGPGAFRGAVPTWDGIRARWGGAGDVLQFADDQFTLASATPTVTLTYLPLPVSVTVYLNGIAQLEGTDWTRSGQAVTVAGAMGALTGDILEARYCYARTDPLPAIAIEENPAISDDFNRADGASLVANRSDGGLWSLGGSSDFEILSGRLVRTLDGLPVPTTVWIYADYGYTNTVTASYKFRHNAAFGGWFLCWLAADAGLTSGIEIRYDAEPTDPPNIRVMSGGTVYQTTNVPNWADGTDRTLTATYDYTTGAVTVDVAGVNYITTTVPAGLPDSGFGLLPTRAYSTRGFAVDDVNVTGT